MYLSVSNECFPCPVGALCYFGRVLPLSGYWSYNERTIPVLCPFPYACIGISSYENQAIDTFPRLSNGEFNTRACAEGYLGEFCTSCDENYYLDIDSSRCRS